MYIEQASVFIKEILDSQIKNSTNCHIDYPLNNWELDFIATICRIGASGKITELTDAQANSLMSTYFRHILLRKCQTVIRASEYKCESCVNGIIKDKTGPVRCKECDGYGYFKENKNGYIKHKENCNHGFITDKDGDHTCPKTVIQEGQVKTGGSNKTNPPPRPPQSPPGNQQKPSK
jgi:Zn finger protein HypA/HybF involved in hydrogenase expression